MMSRPDRRVVLFASSASYSGAERVLVRYLDALVAAGWSVAVVCPDGPLTGMLAERSVPVTIVPELGAPAGPRAVATARLIGRWIRAGLALRRASADHRVIVVNGLRALPSVRLARLSSRSVWLVHDVVTRREHRAIARLGASGLGAAVAVSEAAAVFPRSIGLTTTVVPNGTDWPVEPADQAPTMEGRPIVGINAALTPWKGHEVFLEAMAGLPSVEVELLGAGFPKDGPHIERLRARVDRPDLSGRVRFLGHVDDPLAQMRRWTVAVSASIEPEAGPLAVLEAMSLGLPVVATNHGGAPELLQDIGSLVPPGDARAMREAVAALVTDPERCRHQGQAGRDRIASDRTLDGAASRFVEALVDLPPGADR